MPSEFHSGSKPIFSPATSWASTVPENGCCVSVLQDIWDWSRGTISLFSVKVSWFAVAAGGRKRNATLASSRASCTVIKLPKDLGDMWHSTKPLSVVSKSLACFASDWAISLMVRKYQLHYPKVDIGISSVDMTAADHVSPGRPGLSPGFGFQKGKVYRAFLHRYDLKHPAPTSKVLVPA